MAEALKRRETSEPETNFVQYMKDTRRVRPHKQQEEQKAFAQPLIAYRRSKSSLSKDENKRETEGGTRAAVRQVRLIRFTRS